MTFSLRNASFIALAFVVMHLTLPDSVLGEETDGSDSTLTREQLEQLIGPLDGGTEEGNRTDVRRVGEPTNSTQDAPSQERRDSDADLSPIIELPGDKEAVPETPIGPKSQQLRDFERSRDTRINNMSHHGCNSCHG